jgi:HSP20 family protein
LFELNPGLKKEDLHVQVEDDRTLYISYGNQPKEEAKEGEVPFAGTSQSKEQKSSFMRKFQLPENADLEQIKAEVANETLTVTVPKRKPKSPEIRSIEVSEAGAPATNPQAASSAQEGEVADKSEQPSSSDAEPATSTA